MTTAQDKAMKALRTERKRLGLKRIELWVPAKLVKRVREAVKVICG